MLSIKKKEGCFLTRRLSNSGGAAQVNCRSAPLDEFLLQTLGQAGDGGSRETEDGVLGHWTPLNLGELGFLHKDVLLQRLHEVLLCINQISHVPYGREARASEKWTRSGLPQIPEQK